MKSLRNYRLDYETIPSDDIVSARLKSFRLKLAWKKRKSANLKKKERV